MDNEKDLPEFTLSDVMRQIQELTPEEPDVDDDNTAEVAAILSNLVDVSDEADTTLEATMDAAELEQVQQALTEAAEAAEASVTQEDILAPVPGEEEITGELVLTEADPEPEEASTLEEEVAPEEPTGVLPEEPAAVPEPEVSPVDDTTGPIPLSRSEKLRALKRKLVAGPEKQYYVLSEMGVGKLQLGILLNVIILLLCGAAIFLYTRELVPQNRMKLMIFSQVLAMLGSGLLGCNILLDGLGDLFRLRYSVNTTLAISFLACCADAWFCLDEQRVPCCAAFVLVMTLAMMARYEKRSTDIAQLDTMRKAVSLTSLVKEPDFYDKRTGILRGQGDVEDFMDTYSRLSGPEVVQRVFAFVALLACIGISVLAYLLHNVQMAVQIFATSLLVSVPAGYFVALTRPAYLLQKRLHMVGAVICGWQGVKKLCGKAVVPLREKDLFPRGSTKLNGIKFYSERTPAEVVSYTASLIFAAGGGLVPLFRNLLTSRNGVEYPVENFQDYGGGGIGGEVNGEPILIGSQEFLEKMGVEIPKGTTVSQAVYVSVDGELAAVIAISYAKMRSSAAGILSLCGCRKLRTLLLTGDFMVTDTFVRSKFNIRTRRLILPPKEVRGELAARKANPEADVLALLTRDDLISTAYTVTGAMALRTACRVGSFICILGGMVGVAVMMILAYLGSTELLTPAHVMLYQLAWLIPAMLATEWTRTV